MLRAFIDSRIGGAMASSHTSLSDVLKTPWYQKFISYLEIRSGAMTVRASESLLSSE